MKNTDDKLQESIERGNFDPTDLDNQAYRIVFDAIKIEPETYLHPHFTDKIISSIVKTEEKRASKRDFIWLSSGVFVLLSIAIFTMLSTGFKLNSGAFKFIGNYGGLLIFAVSLIGLFQWIERKVLPHKEAI